MQVEYIERDTVVHTMLPVDYQDAVTEDKCDGETEKQAPWGLARISHRDTLGFGTFNKYLYAENAGEGVGTRRPGEGGADCGDVPDVRSRQGDFQARERLAVN